ncbi:class I SAM-dependent methyltransferase [Candidatus Woesearchaeota archaeon]|nr:class I SAM-dependent methyltransferase [Candidatus Woesearchaeota archaeon]
MGEKKSWDTVYQNIGVVQKQVYKLIKDSVVLFRKNNVKRILDLGCGTGRHTIFLAKKGFELYGIDISQHGLDITKKRKDELKLKGIVLRKADMGKLPFKKDFFDAVICTSVINHARLNKIKDTFWEIERVLREKGIFVLQVLSPRDFTSKTGKEIEPGTRIDIADYDSDVPHYFFTKSELEGFLNNFKVIKFTEESKISERLNRTRWHYRVIAVKK